MAEDDRAPLSSGTLLERGRDTTGPMDLRHDPIVDGRQLERDQKDDDGGVDGLAKVCR